MVSKFTPTSADLKIRNCLDESRSFSVIAGAGSGKTTSLITALSYLEDRVGKQLLQNGQRVVCITFTRRAVAVIETRLRFSKTFVVTTLHGFLWGEIKNFHSDIRKVLQTQILPEKIAKAKSDDKGGNSQAAIKARTRALSLEQDLVSIEEVSKFKYDDAAVSNYSKGELNHDDVIDVASSLVDGSSRLQALIGQKYPYIFVDEAQDTFPNVMSALNKVCSREGLPIIGYFGDPMQQIYDRRAGDFKGPPDSEVIQKEENYRSAVPIIDFLNAFRRDVQQRAVGENKLFDGSVHIALARAEKPLGPRSTYSEDQLDRAIGKYEQVLSFWNWRENKEVKQLFLVRQMIARRGRFMKLHKCFTGQFASSSAQEAYEKGEHFLLKPFLNTVCPLLTAFEDGDQRKMIDTLRRESPAFDVNGKNKEKSLKTMMVLSLESASKLADLWQRAKLKDILDYCESVDLISRSDRLSRHLSRAPRTEIYDDAVHVRDKEDWLCDQFFEMDTSELMAYFRFASDNTVYSTQHGSKGEEYNDVVVVFDDVEASWNQYSFIKMLAPRVAGVGTDGQVDRSRKLAYVAFSRAMKNLRIMLFTQEPEDVLTELVDLGFVGPSQVSIF